jgi:HD-like signal output (HDOD) protein
MRLGLRRCQNLILTTCTAGLLRTLPMQQSECRERLWKHGYMTATICRHMNQELALGFQGEEFTAGLMHDLGLSLLAALAPDEYASIVDLEECEEGSDVLARERALLGTDHCEIGATFAAKNSLPPALVAVIYHHHAPNVAKEHRDLVTLVAVADHMATRMEQLTLGDAGDLTANPFIPFLNDTQRAQRALDMVNADFARQATAEALRLIA